MSTTNDEYRSFIQPLPDGDQGEWKPSRTPHCMIVANAREIRDAALNKIAGDMRHAGWRVLDPQTSAEMVEAVQTAHDLMTQRYARMAETTTAAIAEDCPVLLVIDEYSALVDAQRSVPADYDHETLLWRVGDILQIGRSARVHLLLGSGMSLFDHVLPSMADGVVYSNIEALTPVGAC